MKKGVFISYSHADKDFIAPVVKLIRGLRQDLVFQDYDNLEAGKPWEPQLLEALASAGMVVVFWCSHSAHSDWVKKEYRLAIQKAKDIMPIMLDDTQMPHDLGAYQGINMSSFISHGTKKAKPKDKVTYRGGHNTGEGGTDGASYESGDNETDEAAEDVDSAAQSKSINSEADQQRIAVKLFDELTKRM